MMKILQKRIVALFGTSLTKQTNHKYLLLIRQLKQQSYFKELLQEQASLTRDNQEGYQDFKTIRKDINHILHVHQLLFWATAYHPQNRSNYKPDKVELLIEQAFSEKVSLTHEDLAEEEAPEYQPLHFHLHFQLTNKNQPHILLLYLNYIPLLQKRWPIELVQSLEALKERTNDCYSELVVARCRQWLQETVTSLLSQGPGRVLDEVQMKLLINFCKGKEWRVQERQRIMRFFDDYLNRDSTIQEEGSTYYHLENILYILYLYLKWAEENKIVHYMQTLHNHHYSSPSYLYLTTLMPHQDKSTCFKVDLWLEVQTQAQAPLKTIAQQVLQEASNLEFSTWKYKYLVWLLDSVITAHYFPFALIRRIHHAITLHKLNEHNQLASYLVPFNAIIQAETQSLPSHILELETANAAWLTSHTDQQLASQPYSVLCEVLPWADRHPFLRQLYLPYLLRLLSLSLGRFEWSLLTQLYYFGLRWQAIQSQQGYWAMQYVRRYIMSQYSSMGSRRRQIPPQSYFYKIHQETTPQHFYSSFDSN